MKVLFSIDHLAAPAGVRVEIAGVKKEKQVRRLVVDSGGRFVHPAAVQWPVIEANLPIGACEKLKATGGAVALISDRVALRWFGYVD